MGVFSGQNGGRSELDLQCQLGRQCGPTVDWLSFPGRRKAYIARAHSGALRAKSGPAVIGALDSASLSRQTENRSRPAASPLPAVWGLRQRATEAVRPSNRVSGEPGAATAEGAIHQSLVLLFVDKFFTVNNEAFSEGLLPLNCPPQELMGG
jgi:hypothetical protein